MGIPVDFAAESLYAPEAWFIQDVRFEPEASRVIATIDTTQLGPLVQAQREWPGHPKHVPGAVVIQVTGVLGQLHAVYLLDLRPSQGWVGFGTHIKEARFGSMGTIGPPVQALAEAISVRTVRGTIFSRLRFVFTQQGREIYRSEQTAAWVQKPVAKAQLPLGSAGST